ncbi:MAG: DUF4383 domain-containing protein, partial [Cyanobacteria bacterium J06626_18]
MKPVRIFALITGVFLTALGLAGFIPSLMSAPDTFPASIALYGVAGDQVGNLFGIFPANGAENILYIVWGIAGLATAIALDSARFYAGLTAVFLGLLTILGLLPYSNTVFGLFPIYGGDVWLHAAVAAVAAYFGFIARPNLREALDRETGEG